MSFIPLLQDLHAHSKVLTSISYLGIGLVVTLFLFRYLNPKGGKGAIRKLGGFPVFTAWRFFTRRYDFIWANFGNDPHFKFKVLHHNVVVLRGEESRKAYFDSKTLDMGEGYKLFSMGTVPAIHDINIKEIQKGDLSSFNKQTAKLLNKDRMSDAIPGMFSDLNKRVEIWGKHGQVEPFAAIYDLVFQMMIRVISSSELADNSKAVGEIRALYETLEKSKTPEALLLPWFPSSSRKKQTQAAKDIFMKLYYHVELRRKAAVPSSDAIDVLLGQGMNTVETAQFVLAVIFAAVGSTATNASWALVYLCFHNDWKVKAKAEVDALINKHTANSAGEPLHKRLAAIQNSAWESEMPVIELILRETIRLASNGVAFRRNLLEDTMFAGGRVERGDFVAYPLSDAHFDPDIYSSPYKFDPARFSEGREEGKKGTYSYLGWGAGRHACSGVKVAKLQFKIMVTFILAGFEFSIVDKNGKPLAELPKLNSNALDRPGPVGDPCYLKFDRIVE